jgi:hypothetical protein
VVIATPFIDPRAQSDDSFAANANPGFNEIILDLEGTINPATSLPTLTGNYKIEGPGAHRLSVLNGVEVRHNAAVEGGGRYNAGQATILNSTFAATRSAPLLNSRSVSANP